MNSSYAQLNSSNVDLQFNQVPEVRLSRNYKFGEAKRHIPVQLSPTSLSGPADYNFAKDKNPHKRSYGQVPRLDLHNSIVMSSADYKPFRSQIKPIDHSVLPPTGVMGLAANFPIIKPRVDRGLNAQEVKEFLVRPYLERGKGVKHQQNQTRYQRERSDERQKKTVFSDVGINMMTPRGQVTFNRESARKLKLSLDEDWKIKQEMKQTERHNMRDALNSKEQINSFFSPERKPVHYEQRLPDTADSKAEKIFFITGEKAFKRVTKKGTRQEVIAEPDSNMVTVYNLGKWETRHNLSREDTESSENE